MFSRNQNGSQNTGEQNVILTLPVSAVGSIYSYKCGFIGLQILETGMG